MRRLDVLASVSIVLALAGCDSRRPATDTTTEATATAGDAAAAPDAASLVYCEVVRKRLTQTDCDDAKTVADTATEGTAAFNVPTVMERGKTVRLQLAIGHKVENTITEVTDASAAPDENATAPGDTAAGAAPPEPAHAVNPHRPTPAEVVAELPGEVVEYTPIVGQQMTAELVGDGFEIKALSSTAQEVTRLGVTTWDWEVTAKQSGLRSLTMKTAVVFIDAKGALIPIANTPRNFSVDVKVGPMAAVRDTLDALPGWLKAIAAVLAGLAAVLAAWRGLWKPAPKAPE